MRNSTLFYQPDFGDKVGRVMLDTTYLVTISIYLILQNHYAISQFLLIKVASMALGLHLYYEAYLL